MLRFHYPWVEDALCGGDPGIWDDNKRIPQDQKIADRDRAKQLCCECRVYLDCLDAALDDKNAVGIWGGTDEEERKVLRKTGSRPWLTAA